ncbi:PTS-dependent dihydroxyacetone kinase phosphotransferase subunit DhaM [Listeria monocytogenes serotype 1/2a]|nr:PTS-dependent dihydroxyacetone kinase phosphotransferase subunit DhaM [Listeria monocytogenes serotype 1/2a]
MISIVLVSHSQKITEGLQEMIVEMVGDTVHIISSGGTGDGRLGTNAIMIADNIATCTNSEHIYIFCDIGSAILSAETALELLDTDLLEKTTIIDAPLVEGAFTAAVQSLVNPSKKAILQELTNVH